MQGSIAFKMMRGLVYRAAWVLLYILYIAFVLTALAMLVCVVLVVVDEGGGTSGHARHQVTVGQRLARGALCGSLGLISILGAVKLKTWHRRINPLYPEMQIGFHLDRATAHQRLPAEHPPPSTNPLYDRDLDGGV
jgi:hypothetical protein